MTLTFDEQKEFTFLNLLAFDIARKEAGERDTKIPCWLCASDAARAKYRKRALDILNEQVGPIIPFDDGANVQIVENVLRKKLPATYMEKWVAAETEFKRLRVEENNPQAFFC